MPTGTCPECDADVHVDLDTDKGEIVSCEECGTELEVVGLDPVELDIVEEESLRRRRGRRRILKQQAGALTGAAMTAVCLLLRLQSAPALGFATCLPLDTQSGSVVKLSHAVPPPESCVLAHLVSFHRADKRPAHTPN